MVEFDVICVQRLAVYQICPAAVETVARNGVADMGEVNSYLMCAPGVQSYFDESMRTMLFAVETLKHSDFRSGLLAAVLNFHVAALYGHGIRTPYRKIDEEVIF